jgi:hypothetical protein
MAEQPKSGSELVLYQTEDGSTRVEVRLENETVWLTQNQMAELFETSIPNVSIHIRNIFQEGELRQDSVVKEFLTTAADGKNYQTRFYNLDVIISVGYRVKSLRGTQFRIWATKRLREYIVKGFTMDDERLKQAGGGGYFEELLARIRDIRSSEKVFWRKVLDIYATSTDYDGSAEVSHKFFATVQNKIHWAAHGHTAAEVIAARADATKPHMGLQTFPGPHPRKADVGAAKNYLGEDEIEALNLIVSLYLDFAELQAKSRRAMTMRDWIAKLDAFLRLSERDILTHAGKVSHSDALAKAEREYEKFRVLDAANPSPVEVDFEVAVKKVKQLQAAPKAKKKNGNKGG